MMMWHFSQSQTSVFSHIWRTTFLSQSLSAALHNVNETLFCDTFYIYKLIAVLVIL